MRITHIFAKITILAKRMKKELIFLSWRVLCYPGCAVPKELCYYLQAYSSVQAPDSIGVSGDVGEDRFVYPA